jgi:transposase
MATKIRDKSGNFLVSFRFGGRQFTRSLKTREEAVASTGVARIDETLMQLARGGLTLPEGAEPGIFIVSGGELTGKPVVEIAESTAPETAVPTLKSIFDRYEADLTPGSKEINSMETEAIHARHFKRLLGAGRQFNSLAVDLLQQYVDKRARIVQAAARGEKAAAIVQSQGCSRPTVSAWIRRFNQQGLSGLEEHRRSGRPHIYTPEQRAEVIATALTDPQKLGLPFGSWTFDRLQVDLNEQKAIPIKRSRINEIFVAEGLWWWRQETWFGERVEPDFAAKRGRSGNSTPRRREGASSSASTKWVRRRPRASPAQSPSTRNRKTRPMATADPPAEPSKRSTTVVAAKDTSSARSAQRPARL